MGQSAAAALSCTVVTAAAVTACRTAFFHIMLLTCCVMLLQICVMDSRAYASLTPGMETAEELDACTLLVNSQVCPFPHYSN